MKGRLTLLDDTEIEAIHEATLTVLENTGMNILGETARSILAEAGAKVEGNSVKFPSPLVERALRQKNEGVIFAAREDSKSISPEQKGPMLTTNGFSSFVYDWENGKIRAAANDDLIEFTKICDFYDDFKLFVSTLLPMDIPHHIIELQSLYTAFQNTGKHVQCSCNSAETASFQIELASILAGGRAKLHERPIFSAQVSPISSLTLSNRECDTIITLAGHGIPIVPYVSPMTGATAPATIAGTLVLGNAELLGILTLIKIVNPGGRMIYATDTCPPNPLNGVINYDAPEYNLFAMANQQMASFYGLPSATAHDCSEEFPKDYVSLKSNQLRIMRNSLTQSHICAWAGSRDSAFTASLVDLVISAELFHESLEELGEEPMFRPGKGVEFVKKYLNKSWEEKGRPRTSFPSYQSFPWGQEDLAEAARKKIRNILETHHTLPMDSHMKAECDKVIKHANLSLNKGDK